MMWLFRGCSVIVFMIGGSVFTVFAALAIAASQAASDRTYFTADVRLADMQNTQAVIETSLGTVVIELLPDAAPNHVAYFMKLAREGAYDGTTFHRLIRYGIIQGGDPLSTDPSKEADYGTGGLEHLRAEFNDERHVRGAVSAVLVPGDRDSAGSQFFICVTDQPALDGQYTVFARVVEGINVVQSISESAVDAEGKALDRIEMRSVALREAPAPDPTPFLTETNAELADYLAVLDTPFGEVAIEMMPDVAPEHARYVLRLASLGVYDGMAFHRVVPGFIVQTGHLPTRVAPLDEKQMQHIRPLEPELSDTRHVAGIVSMARGDDPTVPTMSFFIVTGEATALDRLYSVFGRVVRGMDVVDRISQVALDGETPVERVELRAVRVVRK